MDESRIAAERAAVVEAARSYIGTPYHHRGKRKRVGVDCATLLKAAFEESGVRPPIDVDAYSRQWHLHSSEPLYLQAILANGGRLVDAPEFGGLALYREEGAKIHGHGAIITEVNPLRIIHAYAPSRCVLEGYETEFGRLTGADKLFLTAW